MREIIKDKAVIADDWTLLQLAEGDTPETVAVLAGKVIVPLKVWQAQQAALQGRGDIGVWIASDERPEALKGEVQNFPVIAVDFPKFSDGRGYSIAYNLRARLGYTGELRAIGDVLRDQLFYMQRVGFNAFATRPDRNIHDALKGLTDFSEAYQASWDQKAPLFRRTNREEKALQE
ncbi:MAG: oxidoreductase [Burkholderiales bacterium RIFCSPLOWO2_02_FULL_57_36]|nr:MAG: oxidoreductase [Burkholderiales bacterium RIFCSPLOWO2_02_FULL_57_36]